MEKTNDYKLKQAVANQITYCASKSRIDRNAYDYYTDLLSSLLDKVMKLDNFAAKVAETVDKTMCRKYTVANCSSKQAWVIACAVVENNIDTTHFLELDRKNDDDDEMSKKATYSQAEEPAKGVSDKEAKEFVMNATIEIEGNGIVIINGVRCKAAGMMLVNKARTSKVSKSAMFSAYTQLMNMLNNKLA